MMHALIAMSLLCAPPAETAPAAPTAPAAVASASLAPRVFADDAQQTIAEGYQFVEGPVWIAGRDGKPGKLLYCEYPSSTVYSVVPGGKPEIFIQPSGGALGCAADGQGRVYLAQAKERRIVRLDPKAGGGFAEPVVLADKWQDQPLNDTNDLILAPDGSVYFTDPTFFNRGQFKLKHKGLYRITPKGELKLECVSLKLPNGLAFSPDGKRLYVNEFGEAKVMVFDVDAEGSLGKPSVFAELKSFGKGTRGGADGLKVLPSGTVLTTGPGGLYAISPEGKLLDFAAVPSISNVAIGGNDGRDVFITAGTKVLMLRLR